MDAHSDYHVEHHEEHMLFPQHPDMAILWDRIHNLEDENKRLRNTKKFADPAVVGLAGFGATTLLLQFHNIGWMSSGPVLACGLVFGGAAQLVAGFLEFCTGNNFGFCAFSTYGSFWISLAIILLTNKFDVYKSGEVDIGFFLLAFTLLTIILTICAARHNLALFIVFVLLVIGFIILDVSHFAHIEVLNVVAGIELIPCALGAWYCMAAKLFKESFQRDIIPVGSPLHLYVKRRSSITPNQITSGITLNGLSHT